jgi:transcriptional regulator with XRE-family HTH domain
VMAHNSSADGPDPIDVEVGITIRRLRKERGLGQARLATALGITFQQVQKYEQGTNRVSASMLVRAAKALSVQPADLLPTTDAAPLPPSAQLLGLRGAQELLEGYADIPSVKLRRALLILVRAMRAHAASEAPDE